MIKNTLSEESIESAAHCLKVLGNPTRLKIVAELSIAPRCVMEIAEMAKIPHNVACEHLRLLHTCGFVSSQRSGREVRYAIKEPHLLDILKCIQKRFSKKGKHHE